MVKGEKQISGKWYLFKESTGAMITGWHKLDGENYYYAMDGVRAEGELKLEGKWYNFDSTTGAMITGWYDFPNKRVYYDKNGVMVKGKYTIEGKTYFFKESTGELIKNSFVDGEYYGPDGVLVPEEKYNSIFYRISGDSKTSINQMVEFYEENSPVDYPEKDLKKGGAGTIEKLAEIFYEEAAEEEIKVEVAWAQTMYETGWLQFGGQVKIGQYNFAGLGATDNGANGATFKDIRTGVRAQIQHLKAYASEEVLKNDCVDPRFNYVNRGTAQYVEILGQQENPNGYGWASSKGYGLGIRKLISVLEESF